MNRSSTLYLSIFAALFLTACGSEQDDASGDAATADRGMRETMDSAMDDAQEAAGEAADTAEDAANDMARSAGEMADDMAQEAQDAADDVAQAAGDMSDQVAQAAGDAADTMSAAADDAADGAAAAAAGAMAAAGVAAADDDDPCTLAIEVGDNIAYSIDAMSAPASCSEVSVTITHTGSLPAVAMGHNWVLLPEDALESVATAGVAAGLEADYVPEDDRIVAATGVVGGGESDTITFSLGGLQDGVTYKYVCTFPGHWAVMQGTFTVSG